MVEKDKFFREIINPSKWKRFEEYAPELQKRLAEDLRRAEDRNKRLFEPTRKLLESEYEIKSLSEDDLGWAQDQLYGQRVCAVDGTYSSYSLLSGVRGQIGVAAVSYARESFEEVLFVFEPDIELDELDVTEILKKRKQSERALSSMVIRAVMLYTERRIALERPELWKLVHGSLIPYELRTGLGRYKALPVCLELARHVIENEHVIGVVESSTHDELRSVGMSLRPEKLEYVAMKDFADELQLYLEGDDLTEGAHFNPEDKAQVESFKEELGHKILVGLYRAGPKSYLFEAHRDHFDEAAAIVIRDSLHQPERGFPLLIDHADSICSYVLSASDFKKRVEIELAKLNAWGREVYERRTRRR